MRAPDGDDPGAQPPPRADADERSPSDRAQQPTTDAPTLQRMRDELEDRARRLAAQEEEFELKNRELERTKMLLKHEAEQLATASLYKSQFLASMSHELRTPLNSMLILSKMLGDNAGGNLTAKQADYAQIIHSSGNDLLTLIDEVLDLCKMEAGTMRVDLGDVDVAALAQFCDRAMRPVADDRGIDFQILVNEDVPRRLHTDARRLQQVLKNLLSNAFKFTERGRVELLIRRATEAWRGEDHGAGAGGPVIAFIVRDTGIGIPRDKHRMIFEAFQQADGTTSRRYGGTGLGLSISREIAHLLGGEIRVDSEPGVGSTFSLLLPAWHVPVARRLSVAPEAAALVRSDRPDGTAVEATRSSSSLQGRKVLVVDDDARNVYALGSVLEHHGMIVERASNGRDGIALLQNMPGIEAVLMDVMMPEMDGYEAMREIRRIEGFADLPIIAITAQAMRGDREKCLASGASDYISKPVDTDQLLSLLRLWLRR